jgi:aminoglycoside N3'-acetyltransferase
MGMRRALMNARNRLLHRTSEKALAELFSQLSIKPDSVICVHSMLSAFGFLAGGPESVIRTIQRVVSGCTVMVPTFPFAGTALDYATRDVVYDPRSTPSRSGRLTEVLWRTHGALRSLHPTHPCAALGPAARDLINGSELAETPFGDESTYGRYSKMDNAVLLMIHTNGTSIVHRFQEIVDMPNLFLPDKMPVRGLNMEGKVVTYSLRIHTPHLPLYLLMPAENDHGYEYMWYPDYSLLFPEARKQKILSRIKNDENQRFLVERQDDLERRGIIRKAQLGAAEVAAIQVKPWQARICEEVAKNLDRLGAAYNVEHLSAAKAEGLLY